MARHRDTETVHAGEPEPRIGGAVAIPIFQSAMYVDEGDPGYHDIRYIRLNNTPNHEAVAAKLATLEGGEAALVTASGMAAITTSLLTVLSAGDHLLVQDCLYGGTHGFVTRDLPRLGVAYDMIDPDDPGSWKGKVRENTRAVYVETISNPLMGVGDLAAVVAFAREHGLVSLIDNTFASPINFRPLEHGFDVLLHSGTKYLNGHSDIVAGAVVGSEELLAGIKCMLDHLGGSLDPHACFLLHRGMKTLALRVERQNATAAHLARFLHEHDRVTRVHYPGLPDHPGHERAVELFDGMGGMLSFELEGGLEAADAVLRSLTLPIVAPSLGGVETLVTRPAATSHKGMSPDERSAAGIDDGLIRVSVGIESADDLLDDFERALDAL
ncbi:MAG: PLP-dependent transferase [Candidatus Eisenbacteria bacterium]|nr:PLP-dependent transferase [Candidatus Eisenbacteria bacterium]